MTKNTPEFEEGFMEALRKLENSDTDAILQATGKSNGDIDAQFSYNENSELSKDRIIPMLAAIIVCVDQETEDQLDTLIGEVTDTAHLMARET